MLFSFNKLKELSQAPNDFTIENMITTLNNLGFEVEGFEKFVDAEGIKFGKILKKTIHPDADKLWVCETEFDDKNRIILTNATNVEEGKYAVAFVPGSRYKSLTFKSKGLKGIMSEGMFSALEEFGIDKELIPEELKQGIWMLDEADLKSDPMEALGLKDYIIDIDILSNRSDANSYYVLATEIAAYLDNEINLFEEIKNSEVENNIEPTNGSATVLSFSTIKSDDLTIKYDEQLLLIKSGIKTDIPIVDLTNLCLIMTGQPTHAYDKEKIGNKITAKIATSYEKILGNIEVPFMEGLLISDEKDFISAAGAMGFEKNSIKKTTKEAILEIGKFKIKEVRDTVKQIKINSLASRQSSKELSLGTQHLAWAFISNRVNISKIVGLPNLKEKSIKFSKTELNRVMGEKIKIKDFNAIVKKLQILGFIFKKDKFIIPSYRHDINEQQDLNEEFMRFYGYDNFKPVPVEISPFIFKNLKSLNENISSLGYQEVRTYTLISRRRNLVNPFKFQANIKLQTFVSKEREEVRNSIAQSLLEVVQYNQKRKILDVDIFEIGQINKGFEVIGLASTTKTLNEVKRDITNILKKNVIFKRTTNPELHPGVSAEIIHNNKIIGWIGKVHPTLNKTDAFIAEVFVNNKSQEVKYQEIDKNQMKVRDYTFTIGKREDIGSWTRMFINNTFSYKIIDIFETEKNRKVTVRVTGTEEQVIKLENHLRKK